MLLDQSTLSYLASGKTLTFSIKEISDYEYHYLLESNGSTAAVAVCTWTPHDDFVWLKMLFVKKPYRFSGVATHLLKIVLHYNCCEIRTKIMPFYDKLVPASQLVRFFYNHGFRVIQLEKRSRFPLMKCPHPRSAVKFT